MAQESGTGGGFVRGLLDAVAGWPARLRPAGAPRQVRRVVTGDSPEGTSVVVSDGPPPRVASVPAWPGFSSTVVWATDAGMTAVPGADDPTPAMTSFVPGPGGTRYTVVVIPPDTGGLAPGATPDDLVGQMAEALPGLGDRMDAEHPGVHATDTVDYNVVVSGEVWLEVDDGVSTLLRAGDVAVVTGNRHTWHNRSKASAVLHTVVVGTPRT